MKGEEKKPAAKKAAVSGRVFDVSRPGKAPASPTSKPVILGHKPEAQQAQTSVSGIGEASPLLTKRKISIMPGDGGQPKPEAAASALTAPEDVPAGAPLPKEEEALAATALDSTVAGPPAMPGEAAKEPEQLSAKPKLVIKPSDAAEVEPEPPAEPAPEPETEPDPAAGAEKPAAPESETAEPPEPAEPAEPESAHPVMPGPLTNTSSVPETENRAEEVITGQAEETPPPKIDPLFDDSGHIVVVSHHNHHRSHGLKVMLLLLLILLLAAATVNILIDTEILKVPSGIPSTDLF